MTTAIHEPRTERNHYSVLVVEDDEVDRMAIQRCMNHIRGVCHVDTVPTGAQAMDRLSNVCYDLVTLDYHLPDGDGIHLLHAIRNLGPQVVLVTGAGGERTAVQAMRDGALDYIIKDGQGHYLTELNQVVAEYFDKLDDPNNVNSLPFSTERLELALETLRKVIPLCYSCRRVRNSMDIWVDVEVYFREILNARFSHGLCPDCYVAQHQRD